jgi:PadR family transcriptional regulator, regulatory protein PadR
MSTRVSSSPSIALDEDIKTRVSFRARVLRREGKLAISGFVGDAALPSGPLSGRITIVRERRDFPVVFQKEMWHLSCWKPKWRGWERGVGMKQKADVLQGTLALMVLKTLDVLGPLHGYGIARRIEQISGDLLAVNQGTLYPVLLKLEQEGAIASEWGASENNRRARFYRLTREGRKQLQAETKEWEQTAAIIGRFFEAKPEDLS